MLPLDKFSSETFWDGYGKTSDYQDRILLLEKLIPITITKLLDVGCGKGDIVNTLLKSHATFHPIGIDGSFSPHRFLQVPFIQALLPELPFPREYFDMVLCLQVLEHLDPIRYALSILELQRISKTHIIIGVPYKENLSQLQVLCSNCGHLSHAHGHVHSFQKKDMDILLPEFELHDSHLIGAPLRRGTNFGAFFLHHFGGVYYLPSEFVCPFCGGNAPSGSKKNSVTQFIARKANGFVTRLTPKIPYWMIAHYIRKDRINHG
jgi:SAM-dependent methyltransferase